MSVPGGHRASVPILRLHRLKGMHPLLARALELGVHARGLTDDEGNRVEVEETGGVVRSELRGPGGRVRCAAWRCPPSDRRPPTYPPDVPFLPGLSSVVVLEPSGLTVTWPAPSAAPAWPGGGVPGLGGLPAGAGRPDPVAEAWTRYAAEGASGELFDALEEGMDRAVSDCLGEGWHVTEDEGLQGPLQGRVVRLRRPGRERSLTLSRALGVSSLVLLEKPERH